MSYLMPGAQPFFFPRSSNAAVLCVHGFTSSPDEMRWLGESLAARDLTTLAVRLAGHGAADYHDLARTRWRDWYASLLDAYHLLRPNYARLYVAAHSMGGLLALKLATQMPLEGLVVMASPIKFTSWAVQQSWWLKYFLRYTDQTDTSPLQQLVHQEQTRRGETPRGRVRYDRWSSAALAEVVALADHVRGQLSSVTCPLSLIYARKDTVATLENQALVAAGVGSTILEQHVLEDGEHNVMIDVAREQVFTLVGDFLMRMSAPMVSPQ